MTPDEQAARQRWHDFRRNVGLAGIALWILLGLLPIAALGFLLVSGDEIRGTWLELLLTTFLPSALFTVSTYYAVGVRRTDDADRSRKLCWQQVAWFGAGVVAFLGSRIIYS